ncbi:hypothetical protein SLUN_17270 [Streptomyces lunaelactis]|uniref:Uncharacterized protein n=1 Tax=Streptomyces lunaelactis TaxID=1535768 RepID=A0A2R4T3J4_9ACTN|nr:hypothetical protein SLUN_17270 [Streptomyces lunaelactis]
MVHTVRRTLWGVEQRHAARVHRRRTAHIPGPGAAARATPVKPGLGTTRIPRSVPERHPDSGP